MYHLFTSIQLIKFDCISIAQNTSDIEYNQSTFYKDAQRVLQRVYFMKINNYCLKKKMDDSFLSIKVNELDYTSNAQNASNVEYNQSTFYNQAQRVLQRVYFIKIKLFLFKPKKCMIYLILSNLLNLIIHQSHKTNPTFNTIKAPFITKRREYYSVFTL